MSTNKGEWELVWQQANKIFTVLLLLLFYNSLPAQEIFSWSRETGYCNPSVVGLPRAKALVLKYELQPGYKI
ncbi:MAG TPA: hypothetical protein VLD19_13845, partial [Chitinophagaceae bacterium]|nr:hypothetical protein [Chitinophagaceae bacterium]